MLSLFISAKYHNNRVTCYIYSILGHNSITDPGTGFFGAKILEKGHNSYQMEKYGKKEQL
jgi:hypothetical protein